MADDNPLDCLCEHCRKKLREFSGLLIYLPSTTSVERDARDARLRALFDGANYRELAARFRLSIRQIRRIVSPNK